MIRFFLLTALALASCATTPVPTGDRIVSVSWRNQAPHSYSFVQTSFCESDDVLTLEELPGYTERAQFLNRPLIQPCKIRMVSVVGTRQLPAQTAWIPAPKSESGSQDYHLQIQVFPNSPPRIKLESVQSAHLRLKAAGQLPSETP